MRLAVYVFCAGFALIPHLSLAAESLADDDLMRIVRSLGSFSSETAMMLAQLRHGAVTRTYAEIHLGKVRDEVESARRELNSPASPMLLPTRNKAAALANALSADLGMLQPQLGDDAVLQRGQENALRIARSLAELGK